MIDPSAVDTQYLQGNAQLTADALQREDEEKKKAQEQARLAAEQAAQQAALQKTVTLQNQQVNLVQLKT